MTENMTEKHDKPHGWDNIRMKLPRGRTLNNKISHRETKDFLEARSVTMGICPRKHLARGDGIRERKGKGGSDVEEGEEATD